MAVCPAHHLNFTLHVTDQILTLPKYHLSQGSVNAAQSVGDVKLHPAVSWRAVSQEVGFERDAGGGLGGAAGGGISAASFSVQTLLVSFDGGFQTRLQVRRRRDERPEGVKSIPENTDLYTSSTLNENMSVCLILSINCVTCIT